MAILEQLFSRAQLNLTLLGYKLALEIGCSVTLRITKNLKVRALWFQYLGVISKQLSLEAGESVD